MAAILALPAAACVHYCIHLATIRLASNAIPDTAPDEGRTGDSSKLGGAIESYEALLLNHNHLGQLTTTKIKTALYCVVLVLCCCVYVMSGTPRASRSLELEELVTAIAYHDRYSDIGGRGTAAAKVRMTMTSTCDIWLHADHHWLTLDSGFDCKVASFSACCP